MLTVRIQAIDGTGTCTLLDSQPCRLLTSLHGHYSASSLLRTRPSPSRLSADFPFPVIRLLHAPSISRRDEEGFSSCSVHPCHRAVATAPPECSAASVSCDVPCCLRPINGGSASGVKSFGVTCAFIFVPAQSLAHHPKDGFVDRLPGFSFLSSRLSKLQNSDSCSGGVDSH